MGGRSDSTRERGEFKSCLWLHKAPNQCRACMHRLLQAHACVDDNNTISAHVVLLISLCGRAARPGEGERDKSDRHAVVGVWPLAWQGKAKKAAQLRVLQRPIVVVQAPRSAALDSVLARWGASEV